MFDAEFAKFPTAAPRDIKLLPGLRLTDTVPKWALLLPLFFAAFFAVATLSIITTDPAARLALGHNGLTEGHIVSIGNDSGCRGLASHRISYAFTTTAGNEYRGSASVCQESPYFAASAGDPIAIEYLSSQPSINAVSGGARSTPPFELFFFMPVLFMAFFVGLIWPPIRHVLVVRRLFKNGEMTLGTVLFVKKRTQVNWSNMPGNVCSEVFIQFHTPDGRAAEARVPCRNDWLVNLLTPGTHVHIAYATDDLESVALLDAFIR